MTGEEAQLFCKLDFTTGGTGPSTVHWTGTNGHTITSDPERGFVVDLGVLSTLLLI